MGGECDLNGGSAFPAHMGDAVGTGRGGAAATAENPRERPAPSEVPPAPTQRAGDKRTEDNGRGGAAAASVVWDIGVGGGGDVARHQYISSRRMHVSKP